MAVTLTQFQEGKISISAFLESFIQTHDIILGQKYFFSVRAVDVHKRPGVFAVAKTWTDNNR